MEDAQVVPRKLRRHRGIFGPVILLIIGSVFLLERTGVMQREVLTHWWPLLLIFVGGWLLVTRINRNKG